MTIPIVGAVTSFHDSHVSAPFHEPRNWVAAQWGSITDPPLFPASQISLPQSDISVSQKVAGAERYEATITTTFSGDPGDFVDYERWVHAVRWGDAESASANLERGRIRVSHIGLLSNALAGNTKKEVFEMPGWKSPEPSNAKEISNVESVGRLSRNKSPWKSIAKVRLAFEDADVLTVKRLRLVTLAGGWNIGKSYSTSGATQKRQQVDSTLTIATAAPVDVALVVDVLYDCLRGVDVPMSDTEVNRVEGFEVQRLALINGTRYAIPLLGGSNHPYHQLRHERLGSNRTLQPFSGKRDTGCSLFINIRPFVRQDLIGVYFENAEGYSFPHPRSPVYAGGAPTTAPFWPFVNKEAPASIRVDIARYIDRVIIPLGKLPFKDLAVDLDDFFDVPIPRVKIDNGYGLLQAIEESTGVKVEYQNYSDFDKSLVKDFDAKNITPRELLSLASEAYGEPSYNRAEDTLIFGLAK